jgi:NTP pyrophosphatase (non-canonical NTP hydrolase)
MNFWTNFQARAYATATRAGFHATDAHDIDQQRLQVAHRLLLINTEVTEVWEKVRHGFAFTDIWTTDKGPQGIPIELADVIIRTADLAQTLGVDLGPAIESKMAFNDTRELLHGKVI